MPKKGNVNKNVSKKDKQQGGGGEYNSRMGGGIILYDRSF